MRAALRQVIVLPLLSLGACADFSSHPPGSPASAYRDTRLQYAILTDDQATLRNEFQVQPERGGLERSLTGLTLPFATATETLFWPAQAAMTHEIADRPQP